MLLRATASAIGLFGMVATVTTGCASSTGSSDGRPIVAVAFYPIEEIVRNVASVQVLTLVPPGEEPHEYEPTPKQMTELEQADVVFYLGHGFQPNLEKAIKTLPGSVQKVDLMEGLTLLPAGTSDSVDPHVWLDPNNMRAMAERIATTLDGDAASYVAALMVIDAKFSAGLAHCDGNDIVTTHEAFGYLADAYGLKQVSIAGISPQDEPSAKAMEAVAEFAREHHLTTIYSEANVPADLAHTVADEIGARVGSLSTVESLSDDQLSAGETYASLMRANLAELRSGLDCS